MPTRGSFIMLIPDLQAEFGAAYCGRKHKKQRHRLGTLLLEPHGFRSFVFLNFGVAAGWSETVFLEEGLSPIRSGGTAGRSMDIRTCSYFAKGAISRRANHTYWFCWAIARQELIRMIWPANQSRPSRSINKPYSPTYWRRCHIW